MRVLASQKLPRDSGESIFAARHQDASQGPLGRLFYLKWLKVALKWLEVSYSVTKQGPRL